jgi:MFS family permease
VRIHHFSYPRWLPDYYGISAYTVGAPIAGWISDRIITRSRQKRKAELEQANSTSEETHTDPDSVGGDNTWVPEDRLRATLGGAVFFVPLSVLLSGVFVTYVPGTTGLVLNLICFFFNGLGVRSLPKKARFQKSLFEL